MVTTQTLMIDGTDFSAYIQHLVGVEEGPVYTDGPNTGETDSGIQIFDRAGVRYALTRSLRPLPQPMMEALLSACEKNKVSVTTTMGRYGTTQSFMAQVSITDYSYATTARGERIYNGATLKINPER